MRAWSSEDADGEVDASWYGMSVKGGYQLVGTGDFQRMHITNMMTMVI